MPTSEGLVLFKKCLAQFSPYHAPQVTSRIRGKGQQFPARLYQLQSPHTTHRLIRDYNDSRQTLLMAFGLMGEKHVGEREIEMPQRSPGELLVARATRGSGF